MQEYKGAYALFIGSGISASANIPTGWGIVCDLIKKIAKLYGDILDTDVNGKPDVADDDDDGDGFTDDVDDDDDGDGCLDRDEADGNLGGVNGKELTGKGRGSGMNPDPRIVDKDDPDFNPPEGSTSENDKDYDADGKPSDSSEFG
jgi:hypothetical protein